MLSRRRLSSTLLGVSALMGCGASPSPTPPSPTPLPDVQACETQQVGQTSDGTAIIRCQKLFADAPLVRLPPDTSPAGDGAVTLYGTINGEFTGAPAFHFTDRTGTSYELTDAKGAAADSSTPFVSQNKLLSNRINVMVYEVSGTRQGSRLLANNLRPIVLVEGKAIDERLLGTWEGSLSRRKTDGTWAWNEPDKDVPFRFVVDRLEPKDALSEAGSGVARLADGERFRAVGHIVNPDKAVQLSTGACAPALSSYGEENPLFGATSFEFGLWRETMMHTSSSSEFNLVNDYPKGISIDHASGMASGAEAYSLPFLLRADRAEGTMTFRIHGTPTGVLTFTLARVQGGGGDCQL